MRLLIGLGVSVILALGFGGAALAQETYCGNLPNADCAIITESSQVMSRLESVVFHLDLNMAISDPSSQYSEDIAFRVVGDGTWRVDQDQIKALTDPNLDTDELPQLMETLLKSISSDMTFIIEPPQGLVGSDTPDRLAFDLRLVNGIGYVNLDKLARLDTSGSFQGGWYGLDVAGLYRAVLESSSISPLPGGATPDAASSDYLTITRLPDMDISGQNMAVFKLGFDFGKVFEDPAFQDAFKAAMTESLRAQGLDAQLNEALVESVIRLFDTLNLSMTQSIGLEDKYVHEFTIVMDWEPDLDTLMALAGSSAGAESLSSFRFALDLRIDLSQFNDAPTVAAPEKAVIIPYGMLLPFIVPGGNPRA